MQNSNELYRNLGKIIVKKKIYLRLQKVRGENLKGGAGHLTQIKLHLNKKLGVMRLANNVHILKIEKA